jgi:hypothetical protein
MPLCLLSHRDQTDLSREMGLALWSVKTTPWGAISPGPDRLNRRSQRWKLNFEGLTVCRVKRMTCRLKSDRGNSVVRPRSLREV